MNKDKIKSSLATSLSVDEIQLAILQIDVFNPRRNIVIPNLSFGLLDHEADLAIISKSGYMTEIEIKRSLPDLKADFKKKKDFICERVYQFFYCVPDSLVLACRDLCIQHDRPISGIISYSEDAHISIHHGEIWESYDKAWPHYSGGRRLFIEEQLQAARLGAMRVWEIKAKLYNTHNPVK